jgi:AcrR family transcriptional regulator
MNNRPPSTPRSAGRPRSNAARQAVLDAAFDLAKQLDFSALTIEGIAREAGVGKPTIYRWWPSKGAIVFEALQQHAEKELPLPENLPLAVSLELFLQALFATLNQDTGTIVRSLMAEAQRDPTFADLFRSQFISVRREPVLQLLHSAIERGELASQTNIAVLADLIYGAMWYRLLTQHAPLDAAFAHEIVHLLFPPHT